MKPVKKQLLDFEEIQQQQRNKGVGWFCEEEKGVKCH